MKRIIVLLMCIFMSVNVMAQSVQDEVKKEVAAMDVKLKEVDSTYSLDKKTRMKLTTLMVSQKHKMAKAVKAKTSPAKLEKMEMGFQGEIGKLLGGARMGVLAGTITADDGPGPSSHF